jgi:hypothetical protein
MGRYIRALIRSCLPQLENWSSGTRSKQVEGPLLGWIKFGTRFLCRSRLTHTISSVMQSPWRDPRSSYVENKKRRWGGPTHRSGSSVLSALEMMAHGCGSPAYPSSWTVRARQFQPNGGVLPLAFDRVLLDQTAICDKQGLTRFVCTFQSLLRASW